MKILDIARAAHERGTSINEVAEKMGVTRVALSHRINGNPTIKSLYEIAEYIGCDITDLFRDPPAKINQKK